MSGTISAIWLRLRGPWCPPAGLLGQLCFITSMKSSLSVPGPPITHSVSLQALGRHSRGYWLCLVVNGLIVGSPVPPLRDCFRNSLAGLSQLVQPQGPWGHVQGSEPYECTHHVTTCQAGSPPAAPTSPRSRAGSGADSDQREVTVNVRSWDGPGPRLGHCQPTCIIVRPLDTTTAPQGHPSLLQRLSAFSFARNLNTKSTFSQQVPGIRLPSWRPDHPIPALGNTSVSLR